MDKKIIIASIILALILVVGIGMVGCGQNPQGISSNYFPHNDGYLWAYACKQTIGTSESPGTRTYYFNGTTTLSDGKTVQKFMVSEEAGSAAVSIYGVAGGNGNYLIDGSGVYQYGNLSRSTIEAILILPFPLNVGRTWQRGALGTFEVLGVETVKVFAGTYQAIKVGLQEEDFEMYEWYADGVGLIKSYTKFPVTTEIDNGSATDEALILTEELVSKNF